MINTSLTNRNRWNKVCYRRSDGDVVKKESYKEAAAVRVSASDHNIVHCLWRQKRKVQLSKHTDR